MPAFEFALSVTIEGADLDSAKSEIEDVLNNIVGGYGFCIESCKAV